MSDTPTTPARTKLGDKLARLISMSEPINIAQYMHLAMSDPQYGYYTTTNPIGRNGDFITAPQVSQMFGEMVGIWAMQAFIEMGRPQIFNLVELGPGHGTLAADLLRAAQALPDFLEAARLHLVETSPALKAVQADTLTKSGLSITWHDTIATLPAAPTILYANEFLDVIPFRQFQKHNGRWQERLIGVDQQNRLQFVLGPANPDPSRLPKEAAAEPDGAIFETAPAREAMAIELANLIAQNSGAALLIDYGHGKSGFGDTFQALRRHQKVDVLEFPGACDLTSHVDFEALRGAILSSQNAIDTQDHNHGGLEIFPLITQSEFLLGLGLLERAGRLGAGQPQALRQRITSEVERLALPDQMGNLFKCFSFASRGLKLVPFATSV